jgi:hypothetical protein
MNKITNVPPPSLEQQIIATLANENAGSDVLAECIREVEAAGATAAQQVDAARALAADLTLSPDPAAAHQRVVEAEITRDRLMSPVLMQKLRDRLSTALVKEATEKWWSDYHKVRQLRDDAAKGFQRYQILSEEIAALLLEAQHVDLEVSRINGSAPDGEHRRLRPVELHARNLTQFTRDNPSLASTVVLPRWDASARTLWPQRPSTSLAAAYADIGSVVPPCVGPRWSDADVQAQKRAEASKANAELGQHYADLTAAQERRDNETEATRWAQAHKR